MSKKRARDAVYVATLSEELRDIEAEIAAWKTISNSTLQRIGMRPPSRRPSFQMRSGFTSNQENWKHGFTGFSNHPLT